MNDGSTDIIVKQNEGYSDKPVVQIIHKGKILIDYKSEAVTLINLVKEEKLMIVAAQ